MLQGVCHSFKRSLLLSLSAFCLAGCASNYSHASDGALSAQVCDRNAFLKKYHCSLSAIERAASRGNPDAQYALGYMYFYGLGTTRDTEAAAIWIDRSAAQGQPLAKRARELMSETRNTHIPGYHPSFARGGGGPSKSVDEMNTTQPIRSLIQTLPGYRKKLDRQVGQIGNSEDRSATPGRSTQPVKRYSPPMTYRTKPYYQKKPVQLASNRSQTQLRATRVESRYQENVEKPVASKLTAAPSERTQPSPSRYSDQQARGSEPARFREYPAQRASKPSFQSGSSSGVAVSPVRVRERTPSRPRHAGRATNQSIGERGYTLQMMATPHFPRLVKFMDKYHLDTEVRYFAVRQGDRTLYILMYGDFATKEEARAAIRRLPRGLQAIHPWIRRNRDVERERQAGRI